jgi:taurine dioxygenase
MYRNPVGPRRLELRAPGTPPFAYQRIGLEPLGKTLGACVRGADLRRPIDAELRAELDAALLEWKVLVFRDQPLSHTQHLAFATCFGPVIEDSLPRTVADGGRIRPAANPLDDVIVFTRDEATPGLENMWHADGTYRVEPTRATSLRAIDVPALGGDTLFADMAAAWDNLGAELQRRIEGLWARHDWSVGGYAHKYGERLETYRKIVPPVRQPLVLRHPRTGRRTLWVNRGFAVAILGLEPDESDALLDFLCRQADVPEYQLRVRWQPGLVVLWDNYAVQHYGVNDYFPARRTLARATIAGSVQTGHVLPD